MNRKWLRLSLFTFLVCLIFAGGWQIENHFFNIIEKQERIDALELQKVKLALVISTFYSYYHEWPGPPGPLDDSISTELGGFEGAKINKQHINFFKKNSCYMDLQDDDGHQLFFKPDDSIGTCSVYEGY
jgi:hypothetical protein